MTDATKRRTRDECKVTVWEERDRLHVAIVDRETEQHTLAEWWDDEAREMFTDGFFDLDFGFGTIKFGPKFRASVLGYAVEMGWVDE